MLKGNSLQGSSNGNSLFKYLKIQLCTLTLPRPRIGGSLMNWVRPIFIDSENKVSKL